MCPVVVTGEEVAAYRAELVAPAVISATGKLHTLRGDHGDAGCPSADGSGCTASTGVEFSGALALGGDSESYEGFAHCLYVSANHDAVATELVVAGLADARLTTSGRASTSDIQNECAEVYTAGAAWDGRFTVDGRYEGLVDDTIEGEASLVAHDYVSGGLRSSTSAAWAGTSGACAWSASSTKTVGEPCWGLEVSGTVTIGGTTVDYTWCVDQDGSALMSSTWVDGVRTGPAHWASDGAYDPAAWTDADADGWSVVGDCDDTNPARADDDGDCDGDGSHRAYDCDDRDATFHPGAEELCADGIDQDCDGSDDLDCDGYGAHDCDDADAAVSPGAADTRCDDIDQDCDGVALDRDCDGYGPNDCDDTDPARNPGAAEVDCNGRDDDCDGIETRDCDGDRYDETDCAPDDDSVHPDAAEIACDGIDQDCDGVDACPEMWEPDGCGGGAAGLLIVLAPIALRRRRAGRRHT